MKRILISLIFLYLFIPITGHTLQKYVKPDGSGTVCSTTNRCSLLEGYNQLASGDELILGDGIYVLASPWTISKSNIIVRAENFRQAIIRMNLNLNDSLIFIFGNSVTLRNIKIEGEQAEPNRFLRRLNVDNFSTNTIIEGIWIFSGGLNIGSATNLIVRHSLFENALHEVVYVRPGSSTEPGFEFLYNNINSWQFYGNTIRNAGRSFDFKGGINANIHHNIFEGFLGGEQCFAIDDVVTSLFQNNIIRNSNCAHALFDYISPHRGTTISNNVIHNVSAGSNVWHYATASSPKGTNTITSNTYCSTPIQVCERGGGNCATNGIRSISGLSITSNTYNAAQSACDAEVSRIINEIGTLPGIGGGTTTSTYTLTSARTLSTTQTRLTYTSSTGATSFSGCTANKFYTSINGGNAVAASNVSTSGLSIDITGQTQAAGQTITVSWDEGACTNLSANPSSSVSNTLSGQYAVLSGTLVNNTTTQLVTSAIAPVFTADNLFTGGSTFTTTDNIANTVDDTLFQTERFGTSFSYNIPLGNGTYHVTLLFAEIFFITNGSRVFDVSIEGSLVLDDLDIHAQVGHDTSYIRQFTTTVSDGTLNISFVSSVNNAKISGITVQDANGLFVFTTNSGGPLYTGQEVRLVGCVAGDFDYSIAGGAATDSLTISTSGATITLTHGSVTSGQSFSYTWISNACDGLASGSLVLVNPFEPPPGVVNIVNAYTIDSTHTQLLFAGSPGGSLEPSCTTSSFTMGISNQVATNAPITPLRDNCNHIDNPLGDGEWGSGVWVMPGLQATGSVCNNPANGSQYGASHWLTSFGEDQEIYATIADGEGTANHAIELFTRCTNVNTSTPTCYGLVWIEQAGTDIVRLRTVINGGVATIREFPQEIATNDKIMLRTVGSEICAHYYNGSWSQLGCVTNTQIKGAGRIAIAATNLTSGTPPTISLDDIGGGDSNGLTSGSITVTNAVPTGMGVVLTHSSVTASDVLNVSGLFNGCPSGPTSAFSSFPVTNTLGGVTPPVVTQLAYQQYFADRVEGSKASYWTLNQPIDVNVGGKVNFRIEVKSENNSLTTQQLFLECVDDSTDWAANGYIVGAGVSGKRIVYGDNNVVKANTLTTNQTLTGCTFSSGGVYMSSGFIPPISGITIPQNQCIQHEVTVVATSGTPGQYSLCRLKGSLGAFDAYNNNVRLNVVGLRGAR